MERGWRVLGLQSFISLSIERIWRFLGLHMFWRLSSHVTQRTRPVETDDVYPVHPADESTGHRETMMVWTLVFNDILDPGLLRKSLTELLDIGDWRKLGGRFRLKNDGRLEIHVPRPFTEERPAIAFHHSSFQCNIEEHPLGKTFPRAIKNPSTLAPPDCHGLASPTGSPRTLADLVDTDKPLLTLHVSSFENATLVTLTYSHIIMDGMAQGSLLHAWSLVLSGNSSQVPDLLGAREDVLGALASNLEAPAARGEDYVVGQRRIKGWRMGIFVMRFVWNMMWNFPHAELKVCFLPKKALETLRDRAQNDLASHSDEKKPPFVSDGDILSAWFATIVARSLSSPSPINLMETMNLRFRFAALNNKGVYMGNMLLPGWTVLPSHAEQLSLGHIACQHRKDLLEQTTEPNLLTHLRETLAQGGQFLPFGPCNGVFAPVTNWTKGDFFNAARFEAAVTGAGDTSPGRKNPPGTITFHWAVKEGSVNIAPILIVLGKDLEGNYWIQSCMRRSAWLIMEQALRELT